MQQQFKESDKTMCVLLTLFLVWACLLLIVNHDLQKQINTLRDVSKGTLDVLKDTVAHIQEIEKRSADHVAYERNDSGDS
jgi:predicted PurR-regulated permease PerM